MGKVEKFEDFEVWKLAREICCDVETLFETTALGKKYSLRDQMDKSSGSIMEYSRGIWNKGQFRISEFLRLFTRILYRIKISALSGKGQNFDLRGRISEIDPKM